MKETLDHLETGAIVSARSRFWLVYTLITIVFWGFEHKLPVM